MAAALQDKHPFLAELNGRIMQTPGKRLRPKLLFLCAGMLGYKEANAPLFAAVFELIHTATLVHDDIIDGAAMRRSRHTLNHDLGTTLTVLYGDLLYTRSHRIALRAGRLDLMETIIGVSERMIEGELLQERHCFDLEMDSEVYFDILERKTAHLFAGTTRAAAMLAGCGDPEIEAMHEFGYQLGVSFQLLDDYLDYQSSAEVMGKPVLSDLAGGKVTLPVIRLLQKDRDGRIRELVRDFWACEGGPVSPDLMRAIETGGGLEETKALAEAAAGKASAALAAFPDNEYGQILKHLPTFLLTRKK